MAMNLKDKAFLAVGSAALLGAVAVVGAARNNKKKPALRGAKPVDCEALHARMKNAYAAAERAYYKLMDDKIPKGKTHSEWVRHVDALDKKKAALEAQYRTAGC